MHQSTSACRLVIEVEHQVLAEQAVIREEPAEEGPPQEEDRQRVEGAAGLLEACRRR